MTEEELGKAIGKNILEIPLDENLFDNGHLDSLSVLELVENLSIFTGIDALELAGDLSRISTLRKILLLVNSHKQGG